VSGAEASAATPEWLVELLGIPPLEEGAAAEARGVPLELRDGILRSRSLLSAAQAQTADTFGFKWSRRETFESEAMREPIRRWLVERYGDLERAAWWSDHGDAPIVLDAGCGAGLAAIELFGARLHAIRYLGMDVSRAVDVAAQRFAERELPGGFLQADLAEPPFADGSLDVVFSEGVLHHTDSTQRALKRLARLLRPGGRFLFYVYRLKGPIREFTDDYVRDRLQGRDPEEAWAQLMPLTKLGKALGDLHVEVEVPEDVELLGIPAGRIDVQRLFYWYVCKAYHRDDLDLEELNHINFDWYAPRNAHRQSPEEVRAWCEEADLEIERENVQEAGITIVARKTG
jgi:SAM-dependent methyltransferase